PRAPERGTEQTAGLQAVMRRASTSAWVRSESRGNGFAGSWGMGRLRRAPAPGKASRRRPPSALDVHATPAAPDIDAMLAALRPTSVPTGAPASRPTHERPEWSGARTEAHVDSGARFQDRRPRPAAAGFETP